MLISPLSIQSIDWAGRTVALDLTREQIKASPSIDSDKPVTRQHEAAYADYYGHPYYWAGYRCAGGRWVWDPELALVAHKEDYLHDRAANITNRRPTHDLRG